MSLSSVHTLMRTYVRNYHMLRVLNSLSYTTILEEMPSKTYVDKKDPCTIRINEIVVDGDDEVEIIVVGHKPTNVRKMYEEYARQAREQQNKLL